MKTDEGDLFSVFLSLVGVDDPSRAELLALKEQIKVHSRQTLEIPWLEH